MFAPSVPFGWSLGFQGHGLSGPRNNDKKRETWTYHKVMCDLFSTLLLPKQSIESIESKDDWTKEFLSIA